VRKREQDRGDRRGQDRKEGGIGRDRTGRILFRPGPILRSTVFLFLILIIKKYAK